jgi:hypothetical protein
MCSVPFDPGKYVAQLPHLSGREEREIGDSLKVDLRRQNDTAGARLLSEGHEVPQQAADPIGGMKLRSPESTSHREPAPHEVKGQYGTQALAILRYGVERSSFEEEKRYFGHCATRHVIEVTVVEKERFAADQA